MMWLLPMASGVLVLLSLFFSIRNKKGRKGRTPQIFLLLNGVFLLSLVVFLILLLQDEKTITAIPVPAYWVLIALGVIIGIFSVRVQYVPGILTSAAVLLFSGFVAIFSIGIIFIVLAVIEILIAIFQYRMRNRKLNV